MKPGLKIAIITSILLLCIFKTSYSQSPAIPSNKKVTLDFNSLKTYKGRVYYPGYTVSVIDKLQWTNHSKLHRSFQDSVVFTDAKFVSPASLFSFTFENVSDFNTTIFKEFADFSSDTFRVEPVFAGANFQDKVDFSNCGFLKKADFSAADFQTEVNFDYADFQGHANFSGTQFHGEAQFFFAQFDSTVSFISDTFHTWANFQSANFGKADFSKAVFKGYADFSLMQREEGVDHGTVVFKKDVAFSGALFEDYANFTASEYAGVANFYETKFKTEVDFTRAQFHERVNFTRATFDSTVDFSEAVFSKAADFSSIHTAETTGFNFDNATLPDLIDFSYNDKIPAGVNFGNAFFDSVNRYSTLSGRWHYINLYKSDLSKITMDYQHFRLCFYNNKHEDTGIIYIYRDSLTINGKQYFVNDKLSYEYLLSIPAFSDYIQQIFPSGSWSGVVRKNFVADCLEKRYFPKRLTRDEMISLYEGVLKHFDTHGQKVSYQALDIEYQDFKNGPFILPRIWNLYGYKKEWIFVWTIGLLLFFTIITFAWLPKLNKPISENGIYYIENIPGNTQVHSFKDVFKKIWSSLMYTATIFFLFSLKIENINFKKAGIIYIIIVYSVGILCIGYMANFVLQK